MTRAETYAWASLVTNGLIFFWFSQRILDGWTPADQTAAQLFWTYVVFVILAIVSESVIAGVLAASGTWLGDALVEDERDREIERKASGAQLIFITAVVNILIFQLLADLAFPGHVFPRIDLTHTPTMFYGLISTLMGGHFVKLAFTLAAYRR